MSALVALTDRQLRAGARVLRSLLNHDHPMVQRAIADALADSGRHEVLGCVARMESALLGGERDQTRWERFRAAVRGWWERNISAEYTGRGAL